MDDKRNAGIHRAVGKLTGTAKVNAKEEVIYEDDDAHHYHIIDRHTKSVVGKAKNLRSAIRMVDKRDNAYGGYRYHHQRVDGPHPSVKEEIDLDVLNFDEIEFTDELLEAGILCDKKSLGKKMKYHKGKMKNEDIGSTKYRHHLNQSNIIKKMMEGMEAVELDEKKQDDNFEYKRDKRGFIIKKRGYKKTDDKKKGMKEQTELIAYLASQLHRDRF